LFISPKNAIINKLVVLNVARQEENMSAKDNEKKEMIKKILEEKKKKGNFFGGDSKIGSGRVEKGNIRLGIDATRTKKIT